MEQKQKRYRKFLALNVTNKSIANFRETTPLSSSIGGSSLPPVQNCRFFNSFKVTLAVCIILP
jgi:hypothetical protein